MLDEPDGHAWESAKVAVMRGRRCRACGEAWVEERCGLHELARDVMSYAWWMRAVHGIEVTAADVRADFRRDRHLAVDILEMARALDLLAEPILRRIACRDVAADGALLASTGIHQFSDPHRT